MSPCYKGADCQQSTTELKHYLSRTSPTRGGGSYNQLNKEYPDRKGIIEINHVPLTASYKDTEYAKIPVGARPALAMRFEDHCGKLSHQKVIQTPQVPVPSTGHSIEAKEWAKHLKESMTKGDFWITLIQEIKVIQTTTQFNKITGKDYVDYERCVIQMLKYCRDVDIPGAPKQPGVPQGRLISQDQYNAILWYLNLDNNH
jgi:hypothetical protein